MLKVLLLVAFIQNLTFVFAFVNRCPPAEDISPCECSSFFYDWPNILGHDIHCPHASSLDNIKKAFASLKSIEKLHISFKNAQFDEIPSDFFKGLDVVQLEFDSGALKKIGEERRASLEGLEDTLKELRIYNNKANRLEYLNISSLNVIHTLDIERSKLPKLGNEWFKNGPISLKSLAFYFCSIEEVGDMAFEKLVNLKTLRLKGNRLGHLSRSMFPSPAPHLEKLYLKENGISSLPEDMFSDMPSLTHVVLSDNDISSLPEGIFADMPSINTIYLSGNNIARLTEATWSPVWSELETLWLTRNPLECDSHIEWTFRYRMPENLFADCKTTEYYFKNLRRIINRKQSREE